MTQPNILIVMTDHQRADTALPEHPAITPNLDRFAAEGVTFTNAFCPSPHCCPARATFFTGLYPSRHGVWNNICNDQALSRGLKPGVRLWSEDLAEAGYALHFSGKWHVSVEESPADRGWTEHFVSGGQGHASRLALGPVSQAGERRETRKQGDKETRGNPASGLWRRTRCTEPANRARSAHCSTTRWRSPRRWRCCPN